VPWMPKPRDYAKNGLTYDAAQSGLFMGIGVKL
jgi:hypothetical protein